MPVMEKKHKTRISRASIAVGSAAFLFIARALVTIYQLRFASNTFGGGYAGLIAVLNQTTFYVLLAELGLAAATTSLLFAPVHANEFEKVRALLRALRDDVHKIVTVMAPLLLVCSGLLAFFLRRQAPMETVAASLVCTSASALCTFMALPYQSYLSAADRVPLRNIILGAGFIGKVGVGIALSKLTHSFVGLPFGTMLISVVELRVQRSAVFAAVGTIHAASTAVGLARTQIRSRAKFVLFHRIGYLFSYQSDYIILLLASSLAMLGIYARYQYLYAGALSFVLTVSSTLTARVARLQIKTGKSGWFALYKKMLFLGSAVALLSGGTFLCFGARAVRTLYGITSVDAPVLALFSMLLTLNICKNVDDIWIDTTGTYDKGWYLPVLEACTCVALGVWFVHRYSVVGVLYAALWTNILFSVFAKAIVLGGSVMKGKIVATLLVRISSLTVIAFLLFVLYKAMNLN